MKEKYKVNTPIKSKTKVDLSWWKRRKTTRWSPSFTLVELMVVAAVIAVLAGIVLAAAGGVQKKAARDQAKAEIKSIMVALERYRAAQGGYPLVAQASSTVLYTNLTNFMSFRTNNVNGTRILDPYGYPYWYRMVTNSADSGAGTVNLMSETVEVWSVGPNGKSGLTNTPPVRTDSNNVDDITSWN